MARFPFIAGFSFLAVTAAFAAEAPVQPQAGATPRAAAATPAAKAAATEESAPANAPGAPKITYNSCHVDEPYIAITFDDGPHVTNTPRLLDMLKQRGIHATFFFVGECAKEYPQIVKRILAEGHELGNHSWSHPQLSKMSDASVEEQLKKTENAIVDACGVAPKIMRPPYGAFTARQQRWCNGEFGYKCILWDVDPLDWKFRNAAHVESEILKQTHAGSIILAHDIHKSSVDAMPATLDGLLAKGFKFVTVSELIAMDKPAPKKPEKPAAPATAPAEGQAKPEAAAPAPVKAK